MELLIKTGFSYNSDVGRLGIFINPDSIAMCDLVLSAMLPKESKSKEIDASLLMLIGFPSFAIKDDFVIGEYLQKIVDNLLGSYGCKRFLRDGFKTPVEEGHRLYYNFDELIKFDKIESEWPMFLSYLAIIEKLKGNDDQSTKYIELMDSLTIKDALMRKILPMIYTVKRENIKAEQNYLKKSPRIPYFRHVSLWTQSLYIIANIFHEKFLSKYDLCPPIFSEPLKYGDDVNVQIFIAAENEVVKGVLAKHGFNVEIVDEITAFQILPIRNLAKLCSKIGQDSSLGFKGKFKPTLGALTVSRLYRIQNKLTLFTSQVIIKNIFLQFNLLLSSSLVKQITISKMMQNMLLKTSDINCNIYGIIGMKQNLHSHFY